jgi:hypothetical protein
MRIPALLITTALLAAVPALAVASGPPTAAQVITSIDFDSGTGQLELAELKSERPALAHWGVTDRVRRGTQGSSLWCAGTALHPVFGPSTFFPTYPYLGQLVQRTAEPVKLVLTRPTRLTHQGFAGATVSNIVVRSEPNAGTIYKAGTHYVVARDAQGYTTIARKGSAIASGATVYVNYRWPTNGTRGVATLRLPESADYFRTYLSLHYLMPSIGAADTNSFSVNWRDPSKANNKRDARYGFAKTSATTWQRLSWELSAGENAPLSRAAGEVNLQFFDFNEAAGATKNGQGAAVDDIVVTGYKYGPIRELTAAPQGSAMRLRWTKPAHSTTDSKADSRALTYRVWRRVAGQSVWRELTTERITATEFTDSTGEAGLTYVYVVQAWDTGTGAAYGQPQEWKVSPSGQVTRSARVTIAAPATPRYAALSAVTGALTDDVGTPLARRTAELWRSLDAVKWSRVETATTGTDGSYSFAVRPTRSTYYRVRFSDAVYGTTVSATRRVLPKVALSSPSAGATTLSFGRSYTFAGALRPRHAAGTRPVTIQAYRSEGGRWVLRRTYAARASNLSSYSRYSASFSLPLRGTWRVRAYHPRDSLNAATYSSSRTVR